MTAFLPGVRAVARRRAWAITFIAALAGCGGKVVVDDDDTHTSTTSSSGSSSTSTSSSSGGPDGEWTTLIDGTWDLTAGTEGYWCTLKTIQQDTYIKAFRAISPAGTHHTLLLRASGGQPDGESSCGPTLGADMYHASGVGTDDLTFPPGVAVKIPAGTQLMLNLHLFNTTSGPLDGVSGTQVKIVPASEVQQIAEMILAGPTSIEVPPNGSQTVEGTCHFPGASTIATVWPHMHQYGTHMKVTYEGASGTKVLHDGAYSFGDQKNYPIDPLPVAPGETIRIQCTYQNPTSQPVYWGDSSKAEMCFAGLYRYPALDQSCF